MGEKNVQTSEEERVFHKYLNGAASFAAGVSAAAFVFFYLGYDGATLEGSALFLIASFIGFGVSRYYAVTNAIKPRTEESGLKGHVCHELNKSTKLAMKGSQ